MPGAKNALQELSKKEAFFVKSETASKDFSQIQDKHLVFYDKWIDEKYR